MATDHSRVHSSIHSGCLLPRVCIAFRIFKRCKYNLLFIYRILYFRSTQSSCKYNNGQYVLPSFQNQDYRMNKITTLNYRNNISFWKNMSDKYCNTNESFVCFRSSSLTTERRSFIWRIFTRACSSWWLQWLACPCVCKALPSPPPD